MINRNWGISAKIPIADTRPSEALFAVLPMTNLQASLLDGVDTIDMRAEADQAARGCASFLTAAAAYRLPAARSSNHVFPPIFHVSVPRHGDRSSTGNNCR